MVGPTRVRSGHAVEVRLMNRLAWHAVVERVARHTVDPYAGISMSGQEINAKYLAHTLRIRLQTVRESIPDLARPATWH